MVMEKPGFEMAGIPGFRLKAGMTVLWRFCASILNTYPGVKQDDCKAMQF